jgi:hypothetical protein
MRSYSKHIWMADMNWEHSSACRNQKRDDIIILRISLIFHDQ